jgi:beta-1,4-mannooligosaccharide/beta-1,4-mannosyl-N-acetylglucosamine phosphorylase
MGYTFDFEKFYQMENPMMVYNRNGALFPRKIGKNYAMYSRPSDSGHTPFGDIFYSESPDLTYWGKHRHVMSPTDGWQSTKIGAGPCPIETTEGWLLFYHGVLTSCNGFVYSFGAALLDLDKPWKLIARSRPYIINPRTLYELAGDVPNVTFPVAALVDKDTGKVAIYYGCADTVTGLVFGKMDEIVNWIKVNSG